MRTETIFRQSDIYKKAKTGIDSIYESSENNAARIEKVLKKLDALFLYIDTFVFPEEQMESIRTAVKACEEITDKEEFVHSLTEAIKPILDFRASHPDKYTAAEAKAINQEKGFIELNRLVSYGKYDSVIHIHHAEGRDVSNKLALYREAMHTLAEIVANDPTVQQITATSWIVAEYPGLFTRIGFHIEDVDEETRKKYFSGEQRNIKIARISREEFLQRFLKKS